MKKILCVLHLSPPVHGASLVGDQVERIVNEQANIDSIFISLSAGRSISDLSKFSIKKVVRTIGLLCKVFGTLILNKLDVIYFTPSLSGFALYRDMVILCLFKIYRLCVHCEVYLHIHMRPTALINSNCITIKIFQLLTGRFNLVLLSNSLIGEFDTLTNKSIKVRVLSNGFPSPLVDGGIESIDDLVAGRIGAEKIILYLGHLIASKGYRRVLDVALEFNAVNEYRFKFAGEFGSSEDEAYFYDFITKNELSNVEYIGVINDGEKEQAFLASSILMLPSESEAMPLTVIEALSVGLPVLATPVGAIPDMLVGTISRTCVRNSEFITGIIELSNSYSKTDAFTMIDKYNDSFSPGAFESTLKELLGLTK